ncbi:hypothetical protein HDU98_009795 [Podochytrium sp. JEL0797]|nr:hypothetical protein HDU98_009795 [Podochytrium sp. JEL0797]
MRRAATDFFKVALVRVHGLTNEQKACMNGKMFEIHGPAPASSSGEPRNWEGLAEEIRLAFCQQDTEFVRVAGDAAVWRYQRDRARNCFGFAEEAAKNNNQGMQD